MFNIEDTEAGVAVFFPGTVLQCHEAKITKLAGMVGEQFLRLYYQYDPHPVPRHIGISITADARINTLQIQSTIPDIKLSKGDSATLYLSDGSSIEGVFNSARTKFRAGDVRSFILLTDEQLLHISERSLSHLRLTNTKMNAYKDFTLCGGHFNRQYNSVGQGQELFTLLTRRIIGMKQMLRHG